MKIFRKKIPLQKNILEVKNLSFVPTMGGLHKGHAKLIKIAKKRFKKVLVSIYVNPKQFNSKNDFKSYPRNLKKDISLLRKLKVDYLYLPSYLDIFSFKSRNKIYLHNFSKKLCGKYRRNHFKGVVNVVNRFLEIDIFALFFICLCFLFIINGSNLIDGYNGLLTIHTLIISINLFFINYVSYFFTYRYFITCIYWPVINKFFFSVQ